MAARIGVLLSGCGVLDGSEIHEAVSILVALDRHGAHAICLAPDVAQADVAAHLKGRAPGPSRNVLEESARIARGRARDVATVGAGDLDGLILPGGFGAAKNLCNFASKGPSCDVLPEVARLIRAMHEAGKPIGLACIAPVVAARVLGGDGRRPRLTIGRDEATASAIAAMNAVHEPTGPTDVCVDAENRLASTPCYMNDVGPWTVFQGAEKLVEAVLKMIR